MKTYQIATIPGDGIGKEVVPAGREVLEAVAASSSGFAFDFDFDELDGIESGRLFHVNRCFGFGFEGPGAGLHFDHLHRIAIVRIHGVEIDGGDASGIHAGGGFRAHASRSGRRR